MKKTLFILVIVCLGLVFLACEKGVEINPEKVKVIEDFFAVYNNNLGKGQEEVEELLNGGDYLALDTKKSSQGGSQTQEAWLEEYRPFVKEESLKKMVASRYLAPLLSKTEEIEKISIDEIKKNR